jgi:hypothetical protein
MADAAATHADTGPNVLNAAFTATVIQIPAARDRWREGRFQVERDHWRDTKIKAEKTQRAAEVGASRVMQSVEHAAAQSDASRAAHTDGNSSNSV